MNDTITQVLVDYYNTSISKIIRMKIRQGVWYTSYVCSPKFWSEEIAAILVTKLSFVKVLNAVLTAPFTTPCGVYLICELKCEL